MTTLTETLRLILDLPYRRPAPAMPAVLDGLFARLTAHPAPGDAATIEDAIWSAWTDHPDPVAAAAMNRAIAGIAGRDFPEARRRLDALVAERPDWAEAWNKRATLLFLMGQDAESIADIHRTLELEPRHFGTLCGFGQIALRQGHPAAAKAAFEAALAAHPHLDGLRDIIAQLDGEPSRTLH